MRVLVAAFAVCMAAHAAAVAWVTPEGPTNDGRLRLGWNDAHPDRADMLLLAMAVVVAITARGKLHRAGAMIVVGAALAQLATFLTWGAAPDYLLMDGYIWNASDVLLLAGLVVALAGTAGSLLALQRRRTA